MKNNIEDMQAIYGVTEMLFIEILKDLPIDVYRTHHDVVITVGRSGSKNAEDVLIDVDIETGHDMLNLYAGKKSVDDSVGELQINLGDPEFPDKIRKHVETYV